MILLWSGRNRAHLTGHGVSVAEVEVMVASGLWVRTRDRKRHDRRWRVVGWSPRRRFITVIVEATETPGEYVPVTSWPATPSEARLYWEQRATR